MYNVFLTPMFTRLSREEDVLRASVEEVVNWKKSILQKLPARSNPGIKRDGRDITP